MAMRMQEDEQCEIHFHHYLMGDGLNLWPSDVYETWKERGIDREKVEPAVKQRVLSPEQQASIAAQPCEAPAPRGLRRQHAPFLRQLARTQLLLHREAAAHCLQQTADALTRPGWRCNPLQRWL